MTLTIRNL